MGKTALGILVKRAGRFLRDICIDPAISSDDVELKRRVLLLNIILSLGIFFLTPYSVIAYLQGDRWLGIFDFVTVCFLAGIMVYLRRSKNYAAAGFFAIFILGSLLLYGTSTGGISNTAYLWSYTLPVFVMFLLGPVRGINIISLYLGAVMLIFYLPGTPLLFTSYSSDFKLRYITTFVAVTVIAFFAERVRERTQFQLEKLTIVARNTDNAVIIMDARGNVQWVNESFTRIYGYTMEQVIEERGGNIVAGSTYPEINNVVNEFFRNPKPVQYESSLVNRSGETVWAQTTLSPVFDVKGNLINIIAVDSDITRLKQSEERITRQNEEIMEQSAALEEAVAVARGEREAADAANRSKSDFLAHMSHELRTPMNGILGFSEMLMGTSLDEEQQDFVRTISRSGETLLHLLNDILDLSKIEAGELSLIPSDFEPREVVSDVCDIILPRIGEKPVELVCRISEDVPVHTRGDAGRFQQVLVNLMGNAAKFTEKGCIQLAMDVVETKPGKVKLHVKVEDTGIGIPGEKLEDIFASFQQAGSYISQQFGGTGLGLSICKQLAGLMDGDVWAESTAGEGSLFHFTAWMEQSLKKDREGTGREKRDGVTVSQLVTADDGLPLHILLAEDNPVNQKLARFIFTRAGYRLTVVENGKEAVDVYSRQPSRYHLIFMDVQMPEMNGIQATEKIREFENSMALPPVPIVAMTADSMKGDRERCIGAGMNDYMSKPVRRDRILEMIEKWGETGNR